MSTRKILSLMLLCLSILSCIEDGKLTVAETSLPKPIIHINLHTVKSSLWKSASFDINYVRFFERANKGTEAIGTVQDWQGVHLPFDLNQNEVKVVLEKPYWETSLLGIDPSFIVFVENADTGKKEQVYIDYIEYLPFDPIVKLEADKKYSIDLTIDLDQAITKRENGLFLDPSAIAATLKKL